MKRTIYLLISSLLLTGAALAQNTSIVIGTNPTTSNGPLVLVDGTGYMKPQVFVWPVGSVHVVQFPFSLDYNGAGLPYQSQFNDTMRFTFGGWVASNGNLVGTNDPIITITADPSLTSLTATVSELVQVNVNFGSSTPNPICSAAPGDAPSTGVFPGIIYLNGGCIGSNAQQYLPLGNVVLNAFPYPGWVFTGWNINGQLSGPILSYNITFPVTITPNFTIAKVVNFVTSPTSGLQVLVDGATISTPTGGAASNGTGCTPDYTRLSGAAPAGFPALCVGEFDFAPGSTHTIGAPSPQLDNAQGTWVFENYNNGLTQNSKYVAPTNTQVQDTLVADFVPGVHVSLYTVPQGLKLMIDGRDNWPGYTFVWGQGEVHQVNAESPQTDAKGHVWSFSSWSDGGTQAHAVMVPTANGLVLSANYGEFPQVTLRSSPPGLTFTVDGSACTTPCVFNKPSGSTSTVVAPASVPFNTGSRYDFLSWSDGGTTATRTVTYGQTSLTLTANYQTSYQLTAASLPAAAATFQFNPTSTDGYYAQSTTVSVTEVAAQGYKFAHWTGALSGSIGSGSVQMYGPQSVTAVYATTPVISPAGIQSATGPTPNGTVAPGSIITIYGQNLAPAFVAGPGNPLSQAIGGTTVSVGSFILPLVYVSPTLIGAQLPWELQPGTYTLVVNTLGQAPVSGQFTVARDAPGVFQQVNPQQAPLALALHENGSLVNFSSPATPGEQITIYGTGFGPYDQPAIDGFPAASSPAVNLLDSLVLSSPAGPIPVDWAGAAPGIVGVAEVKVTIGNAMPSGSTMNLTITVNGVTSAPFVLPMQ